MKNNTCKKLLIGGLWIFPITAFALNCDQPISEAINGEYPRSKGNDQSYEYIGCVSISQGLDLGGCARANSATPYSDVPTLRGIPIVYELGGNEFSVGLTPAYPLGDPIEESWKIWVDFNDDKDFADEGEEVYSTIATGKVVARIDLAGKKQLTHTNLRMRISMVYAPGAGSIEYPNPYTCYTTTVQGYKVQSPDNDLPWGEVEDYLIKFVN